MKLPVLILTGIIVVVFIVFGVTYGTNDGPLDKVVVREYQGVKLDDLSTFRENSIKGIQYVNIEEYALKIGGLAETPLFYELH